MKVLIAGAGIAGLTLALCLQQSGHDIMVVEKAPSLRDEGYMIDFFGAGYDVSEKLGLLPALAQLHYPIPRLVFVDARGHEKFAMDYRVMRRLFNDRHCNFMRGELARLLYAQLPEPHRVRFATTVASIEHEPAQVQVHFSDGTAGLFDVLVGADGVHSHIRRLAFGDEGCFSHFLGYYTAAFILGESPGSLGVTNAFYTLTVPERQVGVYPIRGGRVATFFVHKAHRPLSALSLQTAVHELHTVYGGMGWIVPQLLQRWDPQSLYFDEVAQITMPAWSMGRVVLVGDACQCVSLLAGQGASMAIAGAYILAQELAQAGSDVPGALTRYESKLKSRIEQKQAAGRRLARWFVPDTRLRVTIRDLVLQMAAWPMASWAIKRVLAPESTFAL